MKRSRMENSPWITRETKPGLNKKKIVEFHHDRRQNLVESDKGSWFDQLLEIEGASSSSLDVLAVSKKKIIRRAKEAEESNVTRERLPRMNPDYSSSSDSSLSEMEPRCGTCSSVCFCFEEVRFFPFVLYFVNHG